MRSGFFYFLQSGNKNKVNGYRYLQVLFLAGIMLIGLSVNGNPMPSGGPFFTNGTPQSDTVCANGSSDISSLLTVGDIPGNSETWTVVASGGHGSVIGVPAMGTVLPGGTATPTGIVYIPTPGYSGTDFIIVKADNGTTSDFTTISFVVNPQPSITLGANPAICAGTTTASISFSGATNIGLDTANFTSVGNSSWTVPAGVNTLNFDVQGARGGRDNVTLDPNPGNGGRVQGVLNVSVGELLNVYVGGVGGDGTATGAIGGYNGGGNTSFYLYGSGGAGGGASDIRITGNALTDRAIVAGGGGGNGWDGPGALAGGAGGNLVGGNSDINGGGTYAYGGTQSAGGAGATYTIWPAGMDGSLGLGGNSSTQGISGGGGGGYYGGGGGVWTGGGGGSSYADIAQTSGVTFTQGYDTGKGSVTLIYTVPGTYSIVWSAAAHAAGFRDTTDVLPTATSFTIAVPAGAPAIAPASIYSGTLTVNTASCSSPAYPISVTISPIPDVFPVANQAVCNGSATTDINFTGSIPATFNWTNNNSSIGLLPNGTGHIGLFIPTGAITSANTATITVTPTAHGCTGTSTSFTITDNPIPVLNSTLTPPAVCDSMLFNYMPTSATDSVVFTWSRATVLGISNGASTGIDSTNEYLANTQDTAIPVVYQYMLDYKGCLDTQNVTVNVYPHPVLTSTLTPSPVCNGMPFSYVPTTNVAGTNITWGRAAVTGISNGAASGIGNINETLMDTTANPVVVIYADTLNFNSCIYIQDITLMVNPTPVLSSPLIGASTCDTVRYTPLSATTSVGYAWSRDTTAGISNPAGSGTGNIDEGLVNTTPDPVVVTYTYTLTASGCTNSESITDTIKPTPTLSSGLLDSTCNNIAFIYNASSATAGTTFAWIRNTITGISNAAGTGSTNEVNEILIDTTSNTISVPYLFTLTAMGCVNNENVIVKVFPTPVLNNNPSVATRCDSTLFSYLPTSATTGVTYTWTRAYVPGIDNFGSSGVDSVHEFLVNTTYVNVNAIYHFTLLANGCYNTEDVTLTVHPTPKLSSDTTATICSGSVVDYYPTSYTPTTTFAWSRPSTTGITPTINNGILSISDTLTSSLSTAATVVYVYTLTAYGCAHTEDFTVTVNPSPSTPGISTFPPNTACDNTMYQNFGTANSAPAGMEYIWTADNATIYAMGSGDQYCLVNFNTPGIATIYLLVNNTTTGCQNNNAYAVNVGSTANINPEVIYVNGQFICQTTDVDHYQWGYDDAVTLDSTLVAGETNQNYFNASPLPGKYYWVITTHGGCLQKSYYKVPAANVGVADLNTDQEAIKIYPNPAAENINIEIQSTGGGNFTIDILNMLGQKINTVNTTDHNTKIDVAGLPAGCYLVDCYRNGVKTATAKFIKN